MYIDTPHVQHQFLSLCKKIYSISEYHQVKNDRITKLLRELNIKLNVRIPNSSILLKQLLLIRQNCIYESCIYHSSHTTHNDTNHNDITHHDTLHCHTIDNDDFKYSDYINILLVKNPQDKTLLYAFLRMCKCYDVNTNSMEYLSLDKLKKILIIADENVAQFILQNLQNFNVTTGILYHVVRTLLQQHHQDRIIMLLDYFFTLTTFDQFNSFRIREFIRDFIEFRQLQLLKYTFELTQKYQILSRNFFINTCLCEDYLSGVMFIYSTIETNERIVIRPICLRYILSSDKSECLQFVCNLLGTTLNANAYLNNIILGISEHKSSVFYNLHYLLPFLSSYNVQKINMHLPPVYQLTTIN